MPISFKPGINTVIDNEYLSLLGKIQQYSDTMVRLRSQLLSFPTRLESAVKKSEFFDRSQAELLCEKASHLLEYCAANPSSEAVPYALAAIDYLICEGDAQPEFADLDGFEDDAKVIERVIKHFSLEAHVGMSPEKRGV